LEAESLDYIMMEWDRQTSLNLKKLIMNVSTTIDLSGRVGLVTGGGTGM